MPQLNFSDGYNQSDTLTVAAPTSTDSFLKDVAGNLGVATLNASTIDYSSDGSGPQLVKFDSSSDLTLKDQDTVVITATFNEYLRPGSQIEVTFDAADSQGTKEKLTLSSPSSGLSKTMSETYKVENTVQTSALNVDSYEILSGGFATDLFSGQIQFRSSMIFPVPTQNPPSIRISRLIPWRQRRQ